MASFQYQRAQREKQRQQDDITLAAESPRSYCWHAYNTEEVEPSMDLLEITGLGWHQLS